MSRAARVVLVLVGLAVLAVVFFGRQLAGLLIEAAWFGSVGQRAVFDTFLLARIGLGLAVGLVAFAVLQGNALIALARSRGPVRINAELADSPVGRALQALPPATTTGVAAAVVAALTGLGAAAAWQDLLLFLHGGSFGWTDPVHGLDAGFYVFDLPMLQTLRGVLFAMVLLSGVGVLGLYAIRGAIRLDVVEKGGQAEIRGVHVAPAVRAHLGALVAVGLVLMAAGTWLRRYGLLLDQDGLVAGPTTAALTATLPLLTLQAVATAVAAPLAALAIARGGRGPTIAAVALFAVPGLLTGFIPGVVQRFRVDPNELQLEAPYVARHIAATRYAFGLDGVEERALSGEASLTWEDVEANQATVDNVRLWDHQPLLDTFGQVQEIRTYYEFGAVDNDRYVVDGQLRQIMLSPRELVSSALPERARTWVNETMTYTHGYGLTLGPVNEVNAQGLPHLWVKDLPPQVSYPDDLRIDRPELYFGELMRQPVFVRTDNLEFDYPTGDDAAYTEYAGEGGVEVGNLLWRTLWSIRLSTSKVLLTADIRPDSRVLLYRDIRERARRLAPFLTLDADPYLVIAEGRLVWVLDGYTTAPRFPYTQAAPLQGRQWVSWLRSSVKITIDAYDGTMRFYAMDPSDPILAAWRSALPGLFLDAAEMPASITSHLRYPQDAFQLQGALFATYHMTDPQVFYNREDEWEVPVVGRDRMEPYYTVMKLPGEAREEFIVMLPFVPRTKENLSAWMVARNDGDSYGRMRVYTFPKDRVLYGPGQIAARFNQDASISEKISLWSQRGSQVRLGTMLVIPIEESLIYVQPLYLQASRVDERTRGDVESRSAIPELKRVIVGYGDEVAMEPTLDEALRRLFDRADAPVAATGEGEEAPVPLDASAAPADGTLAAEALRHYERADAASRAGDWAAYGEALDALEATLRALAAGEPAPEPPATEEPAP